MFRSEILRQTGRLPPADFPIENLNEQVNAIRQMYGGGEKDTFAAEHQSLSKLVTLLSRDDLSQSIQYRVKRAIEKSVKDSLQENLIRVDEW